MESLKEQLYEKAETEYSDFIEVLKQSSPEEVINRAYEKVTKEEMLYLIKDKDLDDTEIKALLKSNNLLSEFYDEWLKSNGNFNEMLGYSLDNRIGTIVEEFIADVKQNSKQKDCR
jgi:hypothetical protein